MDWFGLLGAFVFAKDCAGDDAYGAAGSGEVRAVDTAAAAPVPVVVARVVEETWLYADQAAVDAAQLPEPAASVVVAAETTPEAVVPLSAPFSSGIPMTSDEIDALYAYVGVPAAWRADLKAIAWCESQWRFYVVGDSGASLGGHQLWYGWAREGEDLMDPVTNTWVAVRVREIRGRYGGKGGWTCADLLGIW